MDIYSSNHICNHSDGEGRYSYRNQPPIGIDAVYKFGSALAELIGCELELAEKGSTGVAEASQGWATDPQKLESWQATGRKVVEEIASEFMAVHIAEYKRLMAKVRSILVCVASMTDPLLQKFGLSEPKQSDFSEIFEPFLSLLEQHKLDFSRSFRLLAQFESVESQNIERFLDMLVPGSQVPEHLKSSAREDWKAFLTKYQARLEETEASSASSSADRRRRISAANPRFVLRQWVLEEAIKRLEEKNDVTFLQRVLNMATHPFEEYGEDVVDPAQCAKPSDEVVEQRRLCEIGDNAMLGFQCSCSS